MEKNKTILVTYDHIKETETFKSLSPIQQKMVKSGNNRRVIEHGVNVVNNIGVKKWKKISMFSVINEQIVLEISNNLKS